jgi:protein-S-isoprenylcysteine O-methyltransferase Ste14
MAGEIAISYKCVQAWHFALITTEEGATDSRGPGAIINAHCVEHKNREEKNPYMNSYVTRTLSIVATIVLIAAGTILYRRGDLLSWSPVVIAIQAGSVLLMIWARMTFGFSSFHFAANPTVTKLVTSGPYRFVRHPVYTAILFFTGSGIAAHFSVVTASLGAAILVAIAIRISCEESFLFTHFDNYAAYAKRTSRLIPFL